MEAFKIILKEIKQENEWGYDPKDEAQLGEVYLPFAFEGEGGEMVHLKKGDLILFKDDYPKKFKLDGQELISTNPNNLICRK